MNPAAKSTCAESLCFSLRAGWASRGSMLRAASQALKEFTECGRITPPAAACVRRLIWLELQPGHIACALQRIEAPLVLDNSIDQDPVREKHTGGQKCRHGFDNHCRRGPLRRSRKLKDGLRYRLAGDCAGMNAHTANHDGPVDHGDALARLPTAMEALCPAGPLPITTRSHSGTVIFRSHDPRRPVARLEQKVEGRSVQEFPECARPHGRGARVGSGITVLILIASPRRVPCKAARDSDTRCLAPPRASVPRKIATFDRPTLQDTPWYLPGTAGWRGGRIPANPRRYPLGELAPDGISDRRSAHRIHPRMRAGWFVGTRSEPVDAATRLVADSQEGLPP